MNPAESIAKWRHVALAEPSSPQTHFIDLCRLVGHADPVAGNVRHLVVEKTSGGAWRVIEWRKAVA